MTPPAYDASACQYSGEPSPVPGRVGNRSSKPGGTGASKVDRQITELLSRSTPELRLAWRRLHRTGPPPGSAAICCSEPSSISCMSVLPAGRASRRRLQTLVGEFDKKSASFDAGIVPKTGATLVRQWHGHAHTVLVREDGFDYEGRQYRSLTVIAERITGAHWSGPRFFGLTKRSGALVGVESRE